MASASQIGVFGKLPMFGDFIQRNLPPTFVSVWDEWLQHYIAGPREQMGEHWLDIYLTSPVWRFIFSVGTIDSHAWAGIMIPSVDQVGRYYPFSVALRIPGEIPLLDFVATQTAWFDSVEDLTLQVLDSQYELDEFIQHVSAVELNMGSGYSRTGDNLESVSFQIDMEFEEQSAASVFPYYLEALLTKMTPSFSIWTTRGSERVAPCMFSVPGMPSINKIPAMLDGQWGMWGWQQPFVMRA